MGWQLYQLDYMLQTDNYASTFQFFYRPGALPNAHFQPTVLKHWWQKCGINMLSVIQTESIEMVMHISLVC